MSNEEQYETIVVGAGQAGLAMAYYLAQGRGDFVVLEARQGVGESWRKVGAIIAEEIGALLEDVHWATGPDEAVDWVLEQLGPGS